MGSVEISLQQMFDRANFRVRKMLILEPVYRFGLAILNLPKANPHLMLASAKPILIFLTPDSPIGVRVLRVVRRFMGRSAM